MSPPAWRWLGRVAYAPTLQAQRAHREALRTGQAGEELWLLEHDAVVTTGRRPTPGLDPDALAARGLPVVPTERGGLATWHGPGQLVAYVLVDAGRRGLGARPLVTALESAVVAWLAEQGVQAGPRPGYPGVWVGRDKICAVGLHLSGGLSMHGLALNLQPELAAFQLFPPCGIAATDGGVTSLQLLRGSSPSPMEAAFQLGPRLVAALDAASCIDSLDALAGSR